MRQTLRKAAAYALAGPRCAIARSPSGDETGHLKRHGASEVVMGEYEIAKAMIAAIPPSG